jgi:hypothetical protein
MDAIKSIFTKVLFNKPDTHIIPISPKNIIGLTVIPSLIFITIMITWALIPTKVVKLGIYIDDDHSSPLGLLESSHTHCEDSLYIWMKFTAPVLRWDIYQNWDDQIFYQYDSDLTLMHNSVCTMNHGCFEFYCDGSIIKKCGTSYSCQSKPSYLQYTITQFINMTITDKLVFNNNIGGISFHQSEFNLTILTSKINMYLSMNSGLTLTEVNKLLDLSRFKTTFMDDLRFCVDDVKKGYAFLNEYDSRVDISVLISVLVSIIGFWITVHKSVVVDNSELKKGNDNLLHVNEDN